MIQLLKRKTSEFQVLESQVPFANGDEKSALDDWLLEVRKGRMKD